MAENKTEVKNVFNKYASQYADKYADLKTYHDGFDVFCETLKTGSSILELACGPGNITKYILDARPDLKLFGIDLAPNMIDIAKKQNPSARFEVQDARTVSENKEVFDGVLMGFFAPYLSKDELETLVKDIANKLNNDGVVYLSTMEGAYGFSNYQHSSDGSSKLFIYFHESAYIKAFFKKYGLKIIWEKHQPFLEDGKVKYNDYIIIGKRI